MRNYKANSHGIASILCLIILLASPLLKQNIVQADMGVAAVNGSDVSEGDDFATRILGQPWDMTASPYPDFQAVFGGVDRNSFAASGGEWSFTTATNDPTMMMHSFGIAGTQKVLKLGDSYPINAGKYKLLSYWLCSSQPNEDTMVYWFMKQSWTDQMYSSHPGHRIDTVNGCKLYVINLANFPNWTGSPVGLRIDPVMHAGINLRLGWVRLTTINTNNTVNISWSGAKSTSKMYVYVAKNCSLTESTLVGIADASKGSFNWGSTLIDNGSPFTPYPLPESFEPGLYKVFSLENNGGTPTCSDLTIHKAPILEFQKPGFTSGPDYATDVVGNSWGMDGPQDLSDTYDLYNANFNNGIYTATSGSSGDPRIDLMVPKPIDTAKYKYATFRMYLEGIRDVGRGWVERFLWWAGTPDLSNFGTTSDMIVYEGWHTYSIDLTQAPMASGPGWSGLKDAFRLDPHEVPAPLTLHLDYVTLTGDETINRGDIYPITYKVNVSGPVSITFFTDNDKNPTNGRTEIGRTTASQAAQAVMISSKGVYLPLIMNRFPNELNLVTGTLWNWNTSGTVPGMYFISADISDGSTTTTWYSNLSVTVR
ncbi:MAG: hypothetical protein PHQ40_00910 [Anaerolineaceae bacterium]|nr:hypothetical protein [Anaerolineaceae bacterium]